MESPPLHDNTSWWGAAEVDVILSSLFTWIVETQKGTQNPSVEEPLGNGFEYYSGSFVLQPIGVNRPRFRGNANLKSGNEDDMMHARGVSFINYFFQIFIV